MLMSATSSTMRGAFTVVIHSMPCRVLSSRSLILHFPFSILERREQVNCHCHLSSFDELWLDERKSQLLGRTKVLFVPTDAKLRAKISLLNLCRGAKEGNCKLTDAFIPRRRSSISKQAYIAFVGTNLVINHGDRAEPVINTALTSLAPMPNSR